MKAVGVSADDEGVACAAGYPDIFVVDKDSSYRGDCVRLDNLHEGREDSKKIGKKHNRADVNYPPMNCRA